jgi:CubicO group peptidase (beta-lactamase class C family)
MKMFQITMMAVFGLAALVCCDSSSAQAGKTTESAKADHTFPGTAWSSVVSPEAVGYSSRRLKAVEAYLQSIDTTAVHVSLGGKTLFEYGDQSHQSYLASARKSFLAALYGKYVANGQIRLDSSLADLGISDTDGLLPIETQATIADVLGARSGVYHPASNPGDSTGNAPPRGSQQPGEYYLYNNWDFNVAGTIFEKLSGKDVFAALQSDIAAPIGMQDFRRDLQQKMGDASRSEHMAYHMTLSTRDMARFGLLMLRKGRWNDVQVIPEDWVRAMTSLVTPMNEMNPPHYRSLATGERWGYGYMWWVWDAPASKGPFAGAYSAKGAGGQYITVLPALDMVITHKTDPDGGEGLGPAQVSAGQYDALVRMVIAAKVVPGESTAPRIPPSAAESAALKLLRDGEVTQGVKAMLAAHAQSPIPAVREERLNLMGYHYSSQKKSNDAIAIFEMVTKLFPRSANAWDSLGEAKLAAGDKAGAKASYLRSLELAERSTEIIPEMRTMLIDNAKKALKDL